MGLPPLWLALAGTFLASAAGGLGYALCGHISPPNDTAGAVATGPMITELFQITRDEGPEVHPSLAPDGNWLAYAARHQGNWDVLRIRVGGEISMNLTPDSPADDTDPGRRDVLRLGLVPDGRQLVGFTLGDSGEPEGVWLYDLAAQRYRELVRGPALEMVWLGDSRRILYANGKALLVLDTTTQKTQTLLSVPDDRVDHPTISADNHWIYYNRAALDANIWAATLATVAPSAR